MNDFTKEELEYIFYCVDIVTHKNDEHDKYEKLEDKIQSMIDSYCDHELEDWALMDNNQKICIKCENIIHGD